MNTRENSEIRDLKVGELDLISGGAPLWGGGSCAVGSIGKGLEVWACSDGSYGVNNTKSNYELVHPTGTPDGFMVPIIH
jgi:hypothetical protein